MKIYLVGGAVRDKLLDFKVKERDWVVVGSSYNEMIELGYKPVGKHFPVFLHPKTKEEYALARLEKKTAKGYGGFEFQTDKNVTLKQDLKRRDLTINAIAMDENEKLIDPYGGQKDLKNKILKHVSNAFCEDPLRILRLARFASRFYKFSVHKKTNKLMKKIVKNHELEALSPERICKELLEALKFPHCERFFQELKNCDALPVVFPEIDNKYYDIIDLLKKMNSPTQNNLSRFSALMSFFDIKSTTEFCKKFKIPNKYRDLALLITRHKKELQKIPTYNWEQILNFLEKLDAFRRKERFYNFLSCFPYLEKNGDSIEKLKKLFEITHKINAKNLKGDEKGEKIREKIHSLRKEEIENYFKSLK